MKNEPYAVLTPQGEIYSRCWTLEEADKLADSLEEKAGVETGSMYLVVSTRDTALELYTDKHSSFRSQVEQAVTRAMVEDDREDGEALDELVTDLRKALQA